MRAMHADALRCVAQANEVLTLELMRQMIDPSYHPLIEILGRLTANYN
jgi:hypothetical protein